MSVLLYGIVFAGEWGRESSPTVEITRLPTPFLGVGGAPVQVIEAGGLGAAVSSVDAPALAPTVERALAYARVVVALQAVQTVLPMRYACVLGTGLDVVELLRAQAGTYTAVLRKLTGCVEMGARFLARGPTNDEDGRVRLQPDREDLATAGRIGSDTRLAEGCGRQPGTAYLNRRTACYAEQERRVHEAATSAERLRAAVAGTYLTCQEESSTAVMSRSGRLLLRLHFLVQRELVASFRAAFLGLDEADRARLFLTGPWPPYNFAAPDRWSA